MKWEEYISLYSNGIFKDSLSLLIVLIEETPSDTTLDVFQIVPALNDQPDLRYGLTIKEGALIKASTNNTTFRTVEDVNFKTSDLSNNLESNIYETDGGLPTKFLLKKDVKNINHF